MFVTVRERLVIRITHGLQELPSGSVGHWKKCSKLLSAQTFCVLVYMCRTHGQIVVNYGLASGPHPILPSMIENAPGQPGGQQPAILTGVGICALLNVALETNGWELLT